MKKFNQRSKHSYNYNRVKCVVMKLAKIFCYVFVDLMVLNLQKYSYHSYWHFDLIDQLTGCRNMNTQKFCYVANLLYRDFLAT